MNKSKGKKKIDIKRIEHEDARYVTFSKRKGSLFKKACELCVLTKAEIAIIILSPGGKIFSLGHPSVDSIIDRFLDRSPQHDVSLLDSYLEANMLEVSHEYNAVNLQMDAEKKRGEQLQLQQNLTYPWWEAPIENLSLRELERFKASLENLKQSIADRIKPDEQLDQSAWTPADLPEANSSGYEEQLMNAWTPPELPESNTCSFIGSNDEVDMVVVPFRFAADETDEPQTNNVPDPSSFSDENVSSYIELYDHLFEP